MTPFDLLFLAVFVVSVINLAMAAVLAIRGNVSRAFHILGIWAASAAVYLGISLAVAFFAPQRVIAAGTPWCFDDWCLTVENGKRIEANYTVNMLLSSTAKRVNQRAKGAWVYVRDENDRHYDPLPDPAAVSLEVELGPGQSVAAQRSFRVPSGVRELGLVTGHGGGPCGVMSLVIIGQAGCLFHKETMIRLPVE